MHGFYTNLSLESSVASKVSSSSAAVTIILAKKCKIQMEEDVHMDMAMIRSGI